MYKNDKIESPKHADDRLVIAKAESNGDEPKVYAVTNLKAYVKPPMEEEISTSDGPPAGGSTGLGMGVICTCVPVETCVCDTVTYPTGGVICPSDPGCPCTGTCSSTCSCTTVCVCVPT